MIPPVRATEQGTAQAENPGVFTSTLNCSIMIGQRKLSMRSRGLKCSEGGALSKFFGWNLIPQKVKVLCAKAVPERPRCLPPLLESGYLGV